MEINSSFFEACEKGLIDDVLTFIPKIENIDIKNDWSRTGLAIAVRNEHFEVAKLLFENGADINAKNCNGTTIFMYAKTPVFKSKNFEVLEWLLESGSDINAYDNFGLTVLDYVKKEGDITMLSWMRQNGAKYYEEL